MIFVAAFPLDRTWHKVNDPKADYSGDLEEGKVGEWAETWTRLVYAAHWTH